MALVRLAPEPPPLRTSVTKTLAEFRRTHEEAGLSEVHMGLLLLVLVFAFVVVAFVVVVVVILF
jgi:hypothetical protein